MTIPEHDLVHRERQPYDMGKQLEVDVAVPMVNGPRWGGRVEYLSDPTEEPDMSDWKTELAFLTADA
jgi:hypothetical protein